jgi:hypothetical protein
MAEDVKEKPAFPLGDGRQLELPGDDKQNSRSNDN